MLHTTQSRSRATIAVGLLLLGLSGQSAVAQPANHQARPIPDPVFPEVPVRAANKTSTITDGDMTLAIHPSVYGSAITSLRRHGIEYVVNDPPATPHYRRGGSFQGSFFFNSPRAPSGTHHTYYNDCNNPLESGSVADFRTDNRGIASPTRYFIPADGVLQTATQLAYYIDPDAATDWYDPLNARITGTSRRCRVGKINNPRFEDDDNAALSKIYLGKTVTLANVGTRERPERIPGVVSVDMVLALDQTYTHAGLHPAFASVPASLSRLVSYDPRLGQTTTTPKAFGRNPVIAHSPDGRRALAIYSPQIALEGEAPGYDSGYLRTRFRTGLNTLMSYIRYEAMPAGAYKFKSYYVAGTLPEVKSALDQLHARFTLLAPASFDWRYYVARNGFGIASEDQARLHWLTTGQARGAHGIARTATAGQEAASLPSAKIPAKR